MNEAQRNECPGQQRFVSVLFARADSNYKTLGVDVWDAERNALNWPQAIAPAASSNCAAASTAATNPIFSTTTEDAAMPYVSINDKVTPAKVLAHLDASHRGAAKGVNITELTKEVVKGPPSAGDERSVRYAVATLREEGYPICAHPARGYFLAETTGEINETCEFLYARAMHSLKQVAALKNKSLPEIRGQLGLEVSSVDE